MDTPDLVAKLRRLGTDMTTVEVKAAAGGIPKTMAESLSALANSEGGTVLLGLSESDGFALAQGFGAASIRDALAGVCADEVEPPVRAPIEIEEFEGGHVVRLDVPELDPMQKPCWVRRRGGPHQGSFVRGGDGDRLLNHYEVSQLLSNRGQPTWDEEVVAEASEDDLDRALVGMLLRRARQRSVRAFDGLDATRALERLGVLKRHEGALRPTVAGLLCLGVYPQEFFPQLFISFVSLPGATMGDELTDGTRFLDNESCDGSIPYMVEAALDALRRNMRVAAVSTGAGRKDRYDYPIEALRELVVNAVMHRDYSPGSRGSQIQVELYPDRLVVKSPGGLYGPIDVSDLGVSEVSSSRNSRIARLLADIEMPATGELLCENRGSGMSRIMTRLRESGMSPPRFVSTPARFSVTVPQHALLDPDTIEWIGQLGQRDLSDAQCLALAIMRSNGSVSNAMLRAWGVESHLATTALSDLVGRGVAVKSGGRRYASYALAAEQLEHQPTLFPERSGAGRSALDRLSPRGVDTDVAAVVEAVRSGAVTSRQIAERLSLTYGQVIRRIRTAKDRGLIEQTGPRHSRSQSYRLPAE